jgi:hypothetical protein
MNSSKTYEWPNHQTMSCGGYALPVGKKVGLFAIAFAKVAEEVQKTSKAPLANALRGCATRSPPMAEVAAKAAKAAKEAGCPLVTTRGPTHVFVHESRRLSGPHVWGCRFEDICC